MTIEFKSPQFLPTPNLLKNGKIWLIGLSKKALENEMEKIGEKPFRSKQIWNWIYAKGIKSFDEMSNISKETKEKLTAGYSIERPEISQDLLSSDGTRKWLVKFSDCKEVEMVFIPSPDPTKEDSGTLCISSQVGCTLTCKFCHTGTQMLVRNLSAGEIVAQLMLARDLMEDWQFKNGNINSKTSDLNVEGSPEIFQELGRRKIGEEQSVSKYASTADQLQQHRQSLRDEGSPKIFQELGRRKIGEEQSVSKYASTADQLQQHRQLLKDEGRKVTNIVYMGMGEPLFNYDNVKNSVQILNDPDGINISRRKITVSTSGVVPEILKFADEIKTVLAISLHATNDETRSKIMPLNKKYPLNELMKSCRYYVEKNPSGRITFEYVTLAGINDSDDDARNFVKLLKNNKLPALINLIPFNPWEGSEFICSSRNRIMAFGKIIKDAGYTVTIRKTRGQDVMAACGQLKSASEREKKINN